MRIVYDTNIFIDALGKAKETNFFDKIFQNGHKLFITSRC